MNTAPENATQNWQDQCQIAEDPSNTGTGVCAR